MSEQPEPLRPFAARAIDQHYRLMCEHAGLALISTDRDLCIKTWNAAASHMFGGSAASAVGSSLITVIPKEDRARGELLIHQTIADGAICNFEFKHRDDRGRPRNLIATISPVVDDDGARVGVLACVRDITRRITLETELVQRNKMASLGRMAGALAHQFNNILGGVVTRVDFALTTDNPDFQSRTLRQTGDALGRATRIIEALVAFAEGDVRHQDLSDLTEVVIEAAEDIEPEFSRKRINLELELNAVPVTPVPHAQMRTVLEIILNNAAEAMPDGGIIAIKAGVVRGGVDLIISDTGCGMDEETCQRVFEPFYTTKGRGLGSEQHAGLGLAIAHGVLQVLGHSINVSSVPGEGTTVAIRMAGESTRRL